MTLYELIWYFFAYAFLGWCGEVCYAALRTGHFVNRGFLNGPLCPIYGCGVVLVVSLLSPLKGRFLPLFFGSVVLCSALEWLTGFVLEKLFHQRWWDYSEMPFNLNGYICPIFSLMWGFACLIIMDMVHPAVSGLVGHIPHLAGAVLLIVFSVTAVVDLAATVAAMVGLNKHLRQLDEMAAKIKAASNELGENLADATLSLSERSADLKEDLAERSAGLRVDLADLAEKGADLKEELAERAAAREAEQTARRTAREAALKRREAALAELKAANEELLSTYGFGQRRLLKAFPHMTSTRYAGALEEVRRRARGLRKKG